MSILFRPAAAADVEEAYLWYERRQAGLGERFLAAAQTELENIAAHPTRSPIIHRETRRALLGGFPYGVFYRVAGESIVVVACMHARRDPARWKSRK